jgi:hypothetical protein
MLILKEIVDLILSMQAQLVSAFSERSKHPFVNCGEAGTETSRSGMLHIYMELAKLNDHSRLTRWRMLGERLE